MRLRLAVPAALVGGLLASPSTAVSQPECVAGTFQSYVNLGAGGCRIGSLAVGQFELFRTLPTYEAYLGDARLTPFVRTVGPGSVAGFSISFSPALAMERTLSIANAELWAQEANLRFTTSAGAGDLLGGIRVFDFVGTATASRYNPDDAIVAEASTILFFGPINAAAGLTDQCDRGGCFNRTESSADLPPGAARSSETVSLFTAAGVSSVSFGRDAFPPITYRATLTSFAVGVYVAPADTFAVVPEPSTFALAAVGGVGLGAGAVRRRRKSAE